MEMRAEQLEVGGIRARLSRENVSGITRRETDEKECRRDHRGEEERAG